MTTEVRTLTPAEMQILAKNVGVELVKNYGKKKHYSRAMLNSAFKRLRIGPEVQCWALSFFAAQATFDEVHQSAGHACDYGKMRSQMAGAVRKPPTADPDSSGSWLDGLDSFDFDWLDLGGLGDF